MKSALTLFFSIVLFFSVSLFLPLQSTAQTSIFANESTDVGNGGFSVESKGKFYFFDYFFLSTFSENALLETLNENGIDGFQIASAIFKSLESLSPYTSRALAKALNCINIQRRKFYFDDSLGKINVFTNNSFPGNVSHLPSILNSEKCSDCSISQVALFQRLPTHKKNTNFMFNAHFSTAIPNIESTLICAPDYLYVFNEHALSRYDEKNFAAFLIHEAVWAALLARGAPPLHDSNILDLTQFLYSLPDLAHSSPGDTARLKAEFELIITKYKELQNGK